MMQCTEKRLSRQSTSITSDQSSLTTHSSVAVSCSGLTKEFGEGNSRTRALRGVDLDVYPGQITLLVGPSGCGKTTLISIIAGTLEPSGGKVAVLGQDLERLSASEKVRFRGENI